MAMIYLADGAPLMSTKSSVLPDGPPCTDFDVVVHGEPYLALTLLFNLRSGKFLARIWNRTVRL